MADAPLRRGVWGLLLPLLMLLTNGVAMTAGAAPAALAGQGPDGAGAQTVWYLNQDLLDPLGVVVGEVENALDLPVVHAGSAYRQLAFASAPGTALAIQAHAGQLDALGVTGVVHRGGPLLTLPHATIDLRQFELRPAGTSRLGLQLADRHGQVWFTLDHPHYRIDAAAGLLRLSNMNLRLSSDFAAALGRAEFAGLVVGALDANLPMRAVDVSTASEPGTAAAPVCSATSAWQSPDNPAAIALIFGGGDLTGGTPDQINFERCKIPTAQGYTNCTADSDDGLVVLAPDASLQNVGGSTVSWNAMFNTHSAGQPQLPYHNDQHPYLVWNLYRLDADGSLRQIGVSAAKHAFYSINHACSCDPGHDPSALFPTCQDNYSGATNDFEDYLGPRREILPATGQWARCGSIFDPTCSGRGPTQSGVYGNVDPNRHMVVHESDLDPVLNPGAQYFFEYWYVVRDQPDVYASMGYRPLGNFRKVPGGDGISSIWQFDTGALQAGVYLDAWSPPPPVVPIDSDNGEIVTPDGRLRIAVRTRALGGGLYHYDYAVMNVNFAQATVDPAHPGDDLTLDPHGLKLLAAHGLARFAVPLGAGVAVDNLRFADSDGDAGNDWIATVGSDRIVWQAPAGNELTWGTVYSFGFDAAQRPNTANAAVSSGQAAATAVADALGDYSVRTLAPVAYVNPALLPALGGSGLLLTALSIVLLARWRRGWLPAR